MDGSIQFSYSSRAPSNAVVGIAPGSAQPGTTLVSFHNDASAEYTAAVVERFGDTQAIDIVAAAQKFYETHQDAYDYLVIYNNMGIAAGAAPSPTSPRCVPAQPATASRPGTTARSTDRRRACGA